MSPQLEAAIAAIQQLSSTERQQLLQLLSQSNIPSESHADLQALSAQFWQGSPLNHLRAVHPPITIHNSKDLVANF
jgi:hypothetical protein